jgi:hypothetical protein
MTKEEFAQRYASRSEVSLSFLAQHEFNVCSCTCDAPNCLGWAMPTEHELDSKRFLGLPLPEEIYPVSSMLD